MEQIELFPETQTRVADARQTQPGLRQVGGDHYRKLAVQPWDVVDTWPIEQQIGYYRGGALKYVMRLGSKDESVQEASKGLHYLEKLVECLRRQKEENHGN